MSVCACVCMFVCAREKMCVCMCACVGMCVCMSRMVGQDKNYFCIGMRSLGNEAGGSNIYT